MPDAELREVRDEQRELTKAVARIEALLTESVLKELDTMRKRLDKHSDRLDSLEKTQHQALTMKSLFVWFVGTVIAAIGAGVSVANALR